MNSIIDQLSWKQFEISSKKEKKPIKKINEFNRLIAHTNNFFIILVWCIHKWIFFSHIKRFYTFIWLNKA